MFTILYTREALDRLTGIERSDPKSARVIFDHIRNLPQTYRQDPFLKGLRFEGLRRNRSGPYRIIYRVLEEKQEIRIITIDHRRDVYR